MATEFNYVVNLDTSRVMGQMAEVRSQVGMSLGAPSGMGAGDFSGGVASGFAQMASGLQRPPAFMSGLQGAIFGSNFGGTYTNSAMAYTPHYGMVQAETNLHQEWLVHRYGMPAANLFKPPGVSGFEYAMGSEKNYIDRRMEAERGAFTAMRSTVASGVGGMVAGEGLSMLATPIGAMAGRSLATRFLGPGAGGAGAFLGGAAAGLFAFSAGSDFVGDAIQEHYAKIEQVGGITTELGDIMGAGRGMGRAEKYGMGRAARLAAKDVGMDIQEMGDIMAGARAMGMMPTATDPAKLRTQLGEFARSIEEGAQMLHTSLSNAMGVMKGMGGGVAGVERLIGMSSAAGISPMAMYGIGMQGASIANQNLLGRGQGFDLFTGGVMSAAGAGLSRGELGMIGGVTGAGAMIASTQMGAALSPMGDVQLMAAMSGNPLGGIMDTASSALGVMGSGDMIANMVHFQTHKREMLRGTGAGGIRAMARSQLTGYADMIQDLSPSLSDNDAERFVAMNMFGLNEVQAKAFVGGGRGRGGGGGGGASAALLEAQQEVMLSQSMGGIQRPDRSLWDRITPNDDDPLRGTKWGVTTGALGGALLGSPIAGALIGGGAGAIYDGYNFFKHSVGGIFSGPGLFASAEEKADYEFNREAERFDAKMAQAKANMGWIDIDRDVARGMRGANLSQVQLSLDAVGVPVASHKMGALLALGGISPVMAGPGTTQVGGQYFSTSDVQRLGGLEGKTGKITEGQKNSLYRAVTRGGASGFQSNAIAFQRAMEALATNPKDGKYNFGFGNQTMTSAEDIAEFARERAAIAMAQTGDNSLNQAFQNDGGMFNPDVRAALSYATGKAIPKINAEVMSKIGMIGSLSNERKALRDRAADWIDREYGQAVVAEGALRKRQRANMGVYKYMIGSEGESDKASERAYVKAVLDDSTMMKAAMRLAKNNDDESAKIDMKKAMRDIGMRSEYQGVRSDLLTGKLMSDPRFLAEATELAKYPGIVKNELLKKKELAGNVERPVAFGEQESAFSTVNRALKQTAAMLDRLDKRISKPGTGTPPTQTATERD